MNEMELNEMKWNEMEWMNEWLNEWMNFWMTEWLNEMTAGPVHIHLLAAVEMQTNHPVDNSPKNMYPESHCRSS